MSVLSLSLNISSAIRYSGMKKEWEWDEVAEVPGMCRHESTADVEMQASP